jgi:HlyD family secretion protein
MSTAPTDAATVPMPARRLATRLLLPLLLLAAMAALLLWSLREELAPLVEVEAQPVAVRSVEVSIASLPDGAAAIQAPGWIGADPFSVHVSALVEGIVASVLALEGDLVAAGQVVATLVDDEFRLALRSAEAEVAVRRAAVASAEAQRRAAERERQTLVDPTRRSAGAEADAAAAQALIDAADAELAAAEAALHLVEDELQRTERLVRDGHASEAGLARLALRVEHARATTRAAEAARRAAAAGAAAAKAERTAAQQALDLAIREDLALESAHAALAAAHSLLAAAEVAADTARLRLARTEVRTPIAGVVMELLAAPGAPLSAMGPHGADILHVYDPTRLVVRADIPLAEAARVGVGQGAEITVDLLPDRIFRGEVARLVHRADVAKNTLPVKVRILDPDPRLKPDMLARVRILPAAERGRGTTTRVYLPSSAIDGDEVVVVAGLRDGRGVAERRRVAVEGEPIDGWVGVREGVRPGEWVLPTGAAIASGTRVRVRERMVAGGAP